MGNLASGSIDLKGLKVAGEGASKYITEIDDGGISVHDASNNSNYVAITSNGMEIYSGTSTAAKVASFTASGAQIGQDGAAHSVIDANGQRFYASNGTTQLANIGYGEGNPDPEQSSTPQTNPYYTFGTRSTNESTDRGNYSLAEGWSVKASKYASHAEGYSTEATGDASHAEGYYSKATNSASHAEGFSTEATGDTSHAEGYLTKATDNYAHAEGYSTEATGDACHAEGYNTTASWMYSHAEGEGCEATDNWAHAEGYYSKATNDASHAEGTHCEAVGSYSHAQNVYTKVTQTGQTAIGRYNVVDEGGSTNYGKYAFIIGNGTSTSARSNAFAVDWDGHQYIGNNDTNYIGILKSGTKRSDWTGDNYSIPKASSRYIMYITLSPGSWIVNGTVRFASNSTGVRRVGLSTSNSAGTDPLDCQIPAGSGAIQLRTVRLFELTAQTTYYLHAYQSSDGALNVTSAGLHAMRIG